MPPLSETKCPSSPDGRHSLKEESCQGTMNHADIGGRVYRHTKYTCTYCAEHQCDFSQKEVVSEGWY